MSLPDYQPPEPAAASLAAGLAPLVVLGVFVALVLQLASLSAAAALLCTATLWLMHELNRYQRAMDGYNLEYVERHLAWRSDDALRELTQAPQVPEPARAFVQAYLAQRRRIPR